MGGFDEVRALAASLDSGARRVGEKGSQALRKAAFDVEARAKRKAPVDTGHLRNSIGTTVDGNGNSGTISAEVGPTADYGAYVEYGTSRMAPQPYMGPAADEVAPDFAAAIAELGGDLL